MRSRQVPDALAAVVSIALAVVVPVGCGTATGLDDGPAQDGGWEAYSAEAIRSTVPASGGFRQALASSDFGMGVLVAPPGVPTERLRHEEDVVYFALNGQGLLAAETDTVDVMPGTALFVRGRVEHRFGSLTAELEAVVVSSRATPSPIDPEIAAFPMAEMVAARNSEDNVFTALLTTSSLGLGMYMLPKGGRGATVLTHGFPELKIVASGGARFDVGAGGVTVRPGSITYIRDGVGHRFRRISDDLDVLVIWAR